MNKLDAFHRVDDVVERVPRCSDRTGDPFGATHADQVRADHDMACMGRDPTTCVIGTKAVACHPGADSSGAVDFAHPYKSLQDRWNIDGRHAHDYLTQLIGAAELGDTHSLSVPLRQRDTGWYEQAWEWITSLRDPLRLPLADAVPIVHPTRAPNTFAALLQSETRAGILSARQAAQLNQELEPLMPQGIVLAKLNVDDGTSADCWFRVEIQDMAGGRMGEILFANAIHNEPAQGVLGRDMTLDVGIFGLPPALAKKFLAHYQRRLSGAYDTPCHLRNQVPQVPAPGTSLNVLTARSKQRTESPESPLSNELATIEPYRPAGTFLLYDPDTGIYQTLLLEAVLPDRRAPLAHVDRDRFALRMPDSFNDEIVLDKDTGRGHFQDGQYAQGEADIESLGLSHHVRVQNRPYQLRWKCEERKWVPVIVAEAPTRDQSESTLPVYVEPLSKTWHLWRHDGIPVFSDRDLNVIKRLAIPENRTAFYREMDYLDPRIFGNGKLYKTDTDHVTADVLSLGEMGGMLVPVSIRTNENGEVRYEAYDLHDPQGVRYPVRWDGYRWLFDRQSPNQSNTSPAPFEYETTIGEPTPANHDAAVHARHVEVTEPFSKEDVAVVDRFHELVRANFPDLTARARIIMRDIVKTRFHLDIDPDHAYHLHFNGGSSDSDAITGWAHVASDIQSEQTLTQLLFSNFPASAQEHPWNVDVYDGIYNASGTQATHFDHRNQIPIKPSALKDVVWETNFYRQAKSALEAAWAHRNLQEIHNGVQLSSDLSNTNIVNLTSTDKQSVLIGVGYLDISTRIIKTSLFDVDGYVATDMLTFKDPGSGRIVVYMPRHEDAGKKFVGFSNEDEMRRWFIRSCRDTDQRAQIARHFSLYDRQASASRDSVDGWLSTFGRTEGQQYLDRVCENTESLPRETIFQRIADRQKLRALSDLDILITSDAEVTKHIWMDYIDAVNVVLPNPITPFVSLGLHIDQAINGDTSEERETGVLASISDSANIALMAVLGELGNAERMGFEIDGPTFHANVRSSAEALTRADGIEWNGSRWIPEGSTSSHVSQQLKSRVRPSTNANHVSDLPQRIPDQRTGLRRAADGSVWLKIHGHFFEIRKLEGASNRFYLLDGNDRVELRFDHGKFRPERLGERLKIVLDRGMGGCVSKQCPLLKKVSLSEYEVPDRPGWRETIREKLLSDNNWFNIDFHDTENSALHDDFSKRREALVERASTFFEVNPPPDRVVARPLESNLDEYQIFKRLFKIYKGVLIGEEHDNIAGRKILVDNMPTLRDLGVSTIYLEDVPSDLFLGDLERYMSSKITMPRILCTYLDYLSGRAGIDKNSPYSYRGVIERARDNEFDVRLLDSSVSHVSRDELARLKGFNYYGGAKILQDQASNSGNKWIGLVGAFHTNSVGDIPGIAELTNGVGVRIKTGSTQERPRFEVGTNEVRGGLTMKPDYVWWRRPADIEKNLQPPGREVVDHSSHAAASSELSPQESLMRFMENVIGANPDQIEKLASELYKMKNENRLTDYSVVETALEWRDWNILPDKISATAEDIFDMSQFGSEPVDANILRTILYDAAMPSLTNDEITTLYKYGQAFHHDINTFMRNGMQESHPRYAIMRESVEQLQSSLAKIPPYHGTIYRGTQISDRILESLANGYKVYFGGFASASSDINIAGGHLPKPVANGFNRAIYIIHPEESAHYVSRYTQKPHELEFIIESGSTFEIVDMLLDGSGVTIELKEISETGATTRDGMVMLDDFSRPTNA
ncbi:dermonecrotic toxin domain-containing protein [Burkholderia latens]|uniref:dermonecrotic toxin domain-containing protein n=1 Tax=Burkholderia latens TaxID=488446 RepID=UPI00158D1BFB|nr:DUF6543 domain-containing protein [Burkholderia latens]